MSQVPPSIPACASDCFKQGTSSQPCSSADFACLCLYSSIIQSSIEQCLSSSNVCSSDDGQVATSYYTNQCQSRQNPGDLSGDTTSLLFTDAVTTSIETLSVSSTTSSFISSSPSVSTPSVSSPISAESTTAAVTTTFGDSSKLSIPVISGIAAGSAFFLVVILVVLGYFALRARSRRKHRTMYSTDQMYSDQDPDRGANLYPRPQLRNTALFVSANHVPRGEKAYTRHVEKIGTALTLIPTDTYQSYRGQVSERDWAITTPDPIITKQSLDSNRTKSRASSVTVIPHRTSIASFRSTDKTRHDQPYQDCDYFSYYDHQYQDQHQPPAYVSTQQHAISDPEPAHLRPTPTRLSSVSTVSTSQYSPYRELGNPFDDPKTRDHDQRHLKHHRQDTNSSTPPLVLLEVPEFDFGFDFSQMPSYEQQHPGHVTDQGSEARGRNYTYPGQMSRSQSNRGNTQADLSAGGFF